MRCRGYVTLLTWIQYILATAKYEQLIVEIRLFTFLNQWYSDCSHFQISQLKMKNSEVEWRIRVGCAAAAVYILPAISSHQTLVPIHDIALIPASSLNCPCTAVSTSANIARRRTGKAAIHQTRMRRPAWRHCRDMFTRGDAITLYPCTCRDHVTARRRSV